MAVRALVEKWVSGVIDIMNEAAGWGYYADDLRDPYMPMPDGANNFNISLKNAEKI